MSVLGWVLAVVGVAVVAFALRMRAKMKKMETVPFFGPSAITNGIGRADGSGLISTEGQPLASGTPLVAPLSGEPCLAYEFTIERKWEKVKETENGSERESGTSAVHSEYKGSRFQLSDGLGAVDVDLVKQPDGELERSFSETVKVGTTIPSVLSFGKLHMNTPTLPSDSRTVGFIATEKVLKAGGTLYAIGALHDNRITAPDGALGRVVLSTKGRTHLLGATRRNMVLGYSIGTPLAVAGLLLGLFGPKPAPGRGCKDFSGAVACSGRISRATGEDLRWTVPQGGEYRLTVAQPKVKNPIDAAITVTDSTGKRIAYDDGGAPGANARVEQTFAAGTYTITVADFAKHTVSGGYGYQLTVDRVDTPAPTQTAAAQ